MELVAKKDGETLTIFINECIRKELEQRTAFLANEEAIRVTAEEMGIPEIGELSYEKIQAFMSKEKWDIFHEKWSAHHTRINKELDEALCGDATYDANAPRDRVFPIIIG
jgi:hypothetical protein